ncbi:Exonuclease SbcC [hydrothermal vent metagenome]|uniref:Exonuclease SbcC n=1 Tax=hydrothermal vent metagenome TaxID=652676 RepID=A0A1W1C7Q0_9ZZZZ
MKILKLKIKNINSLKGENEIDFSQAHFQNRIFAITGATGAGKSTLLDAITLALYAQTTRLKQNTDGFITKQCSDSFCEVCFEIAEQKYRSRFSQEQKETETIYSMQLYQDDELLSEGIPLVTQKIRELIGLDFKQFSQSIILSQGLFDRFLKAEAKDRVSFLERVMDTKVYATISKKVFQRAEEESKKLDRIRISTANTICLEPNERKEIEQKRGLLEREKKSINLDKIIYMLNQKIAFDKLSNQSENYKKELERLQNILSKRQTEETEYHDSLALLAEEKRKVEQAKLFDREIAFTEKNFKTLEQEIEKNQQELSRVEQDIDDIETQLSKLNVEKILLRRDMQSFSNIEHLKQNYTLLSSKFDELNRTQDELKELISENIEELNDKPLYMTIDNLENRAKELYRQIQAENIEKVEQQNLILEKQITKLRQKESLQKSQSEASLTKEKLKKQIDDFKARNSKLKAERDSLESVISQLEEKKTLEEKILNYEKDRARLKDGEPCLLCGSTHHPLFSDKIEPSKTEQILDEKRELYQKLQKDSIEIEKEIVKLDTELKQIDKNMIKVKRELMTLHEVKGDIQKLEEKQQTFAKELQNVRYQREELETVKEKIETEKVKLNKMRVEIQRNISHKRKKARLESQVKELSYYLIKSMRMYDVELNSHSISILNNKLKQYEEKYKHLKELNQEIHPIEGKRIQSNSKKEYIEENLTSLKKRSSIQKCDLILIKQKRFALIEDESLSKYLDELEKKREKIQKRFDSYNRLKNQFSHQKSIYFSAMEELESKQKLKLINLEAMEEQKRGMQNRLEEINQELGEIKNQLSMDNERIAKLKIEKQTLKEQEEIYQGWKMLNDLIGSVDGEKYQIFAQHLTLSTLVSIANGYLKKLNHRYTLSIKDTHSLELEVIDLFHLKSKRGVNTLSGGESFIVSLALSLALLELHSDQIEINTLFLDEGFETLDEESLKMVISTLKNLESRGKIIGIISHVPLLKEQIKTQIKIDKMGDGVSELSVTE